MRGVELLSRKEDVKNTYNILSGKPKENRPLETPRCRLYGRIILKWFLWKYGVRVWAGSSGSLHFVTK
jgi:hypothetical protein